MVRHRVPCAVAGLGDGVVTKLGPIVLVVQAGPAPVRARCQRGRAHVSLAVQPQLPVRRGWQLPVALTGRPPVARAARAPRPELLR